MIATNATASQSISTGMEKESSIVCPLIEFSSHNISPPDFARQHHFRAARMGMIWRTETVRRLSSLALNEFDPDQGSWPWRVHSTNTMHDAHKQDYLAQAERHITIAEERIARQKTIIDELVQARQETDCAVSMLHALETCLHAFEQHREMIFERCKN
jgi:hypothetical protein